MRSFIRVGPIALLLAGCFAEVGLGPDEELAPTCVLGSAGCECYGNASCDPGLRCVAEITMCVPNDCVAGTEQCICEPDGACTDGLSCASGVCVDPWPQSGTVTSSEDGSSGPAEGTESSTDGTTTHGSTAGDDDPPSSTENPSGDEDSSTGEGGVVCEDESCGACIDCVADDGGACAAEAAACDAEFGCPPIAVCMRSCGVKGLCLDDCCDGAPAAAIAAASALDACRANACAGSCIDYNEALCG